jgi:predicted RNase H-like HicB family nuclease
MHNIQRNQSDMQSCDTLDLPLDREPVATRKPEHLPMSWGYAETAESLVGAGRFAPAPKAPLADIRIVERQNWKGTMEIKLTAVYQKVPEGYIGLVEELPGANTQGMMIEEARENLREAVRLVLEANRVLSEKSLQGQEVIREPLLIGAA